MKRNIHPEYYPQAKVICSCGHRFTVGATVPEMRIEICSSCHPMYTGKMKYIDTAGRLDKFRTRLEKSKIKQGEVK